MIPFFSKLIDAVANAKTGLLLALCGGSVVVWCKTWPLPWVSDAGSVVFVSCCAMLLWELKEWLQKLVCSRKDDQLIHLYNLRDEVGQMQRRIYAKSGSRKLVQSRSVSGELEVLYTKLRRLRVSTPPVPQSTTLWRATTHLDYLEAIEPFLKPSFLPTARSVAEKFLRETQEK